jgi:hypothetical protein
MKTMGGAENEFHFGLKDRSQTRFAQRWLAGWAAGSEGIEDTARPSHHLVNRRAVALQVSAVLCSNDLDMKSTALNRTVKLAVESGIVREEVLRENLDKSSRAFSSRQDGIQQTRAGGCNDQPGRVVLLRIRQDLRIRCASLNDISISIKLLAKPRDKLFMVDQFARISFLYENNRICLALQLGKALLETITKQLGMCPDRSVQSCKPSSENLPFECAAKLAVVQYAEEMQLDRTRCRTP